MDMQTYSIVLTANGKMVHVWREFTQAELNQYIALLSGQCSLDIKAIYVE